MPEHVGVTVNILIWDEDDIIQADIIDRNGWMWLFDTNRSPNQLDIKGVEEEEGYHESSGYRAYSLAHALNQLRNMEYLD